MACSENNEFMGDGEKVSVCLILSLNVDCFGFPGMAHVELAQR